MMSLTDLLTKQRRSFTASRYRYRIRLHHAKHHITTTVTVSTNVFLDHTPSAIHSIWYEGTAASSTASRRWFSISWSWQRRILLAAL
jgi:hypothetical protein